MKEFIRASVYFCSFSSLPSLAIDVRREFMHWLSAVLNGSLGSYLRDALQEGSADDVACLPVPRALAFGFCLY
jgi:hypothetical protein